MIVGLTAVVTFAIAFPALAQPAPPTGRDVIKTEQTNELMAAVSGGLTADQVAARAGQTSYQAKAAEQSVVGADARSDGAWANYFPRVGLTARYTRLSNFTPPSLGAGGIVATPATSGTITTPALPAPGPYQVTTPLFASSFSFPLVLDNYLTQATIAVPISDYFLRITQSYTAATHAADAARWDVVTARAASASNGKIAYYTWLSARGALGVADQSLAVAQAHLKDAQNQFAVGNASRADVLRAETQVAAGELGVEHAKAGVTVAEQQVRVAMHAPDEEKMEPGESLDGPVSPAPTGLRPLLTEAASQRPEIKSIDMNADSARKLADAQRAGRYPVVSGFGDVTYANPNQRRFPATQDWFPTWSLGAQVTWSPNDYLVAGPGAADYDSRAAGLEAQKQTVRDGITIEVTQAYAALLESDTAMQTTTRQLESALEGYRVARELFNAGRGTSTTLIDAENALAQTRFDYLNARVNARLARIRLDHALGRDAK